MPTQTRSRAGGTWLAAAMIVFIAAMTWIPTWDAPYAEDDWLFLEAVRGPEGPGLAHYLAHEGVMDHHYRPLSDPFFFALTSAVGGLNPIAYHIVLWLLHALTGALVLLLGRRIGLPGAAALLAGLIYVTRDLAFPALTWGSGISDVGSACLGLAALYALAIWLGEGSTRHRVLSVLTFAAAMLTKETAIVVLGLAAVLAAYVWLRDRAPGSLGGAVGRAIWPFALVGFPLAAFQVSLARFAETGGQHLYELSLEGHALRIWPVYLAWTVTGVRELLDVRALTWVVIGVGYGLAALVMVRAIPDLRRLRSEVVKGMRVSLSVAGLFAIVWFLVALSPALLAPNRILTNYLVLAAVGPCWWMGLAVVRGLRSPSRTVGAIAFVLGVVALATGPIVVQMKERDVLATGGWVDVGKARELDRVVRALVEEALPAPAPGATLIVFGGLLHDVRVLGDPRGRGFGVQQAMGSAIRVRYDRADIEAISLPPLEATGPEGFGIVVTILREAGPSAHVVSVNGEVRDLTEPARAVLSRGGSPADLRRALLSE